MLAQKLLWAISLDEQTLEDFGLNFEITLILCDKTSVINYSTNPIQHFRTKHIDNRHHFLKDHVEKCDINLRIC